MDGVRENAGGLRGLKWVVVLALCVFAARMASLVFGGLELAADEAQYWDWSRHLSLSYYSKGPGVAWVIWLSTQAFGHAEWAVRLPSAIAGALTVVLVGGFAARVSHRSRLASRAVWSAGVAACVTPALLVPGSFMTIDAPYIACWIAAAWLGWEVLRREHRGKSAVWLSVALGAMLGVGFLFKYTMLLIVPGLLIAALLRDRPRWTRSTTAHALVAAGAFVVVSLPVVIWNAQHGWPTVAHLLGHLRLAGGDMPVTRDDGAGWSAWWAAEYVLSQVGMAGPMIVVMALACWGAVRGRLAGEDDGDERGRWADVYCVCVSVPIFAVYLGVSLMTKVQGNWPIAGYAALCIPAGRLVAAEMERYRKMVARWREDPARPRMGLLRRKPETPVQVLWHWSIGYGIAAGIGLMLLGWVGSLPLVREVVPMHRLSGERERAEALGRIIRDEIGEDASETLVMGARYTHAALMAYYLHGVFGDGMGPTVGSAAAYLGERESSYDYWEETDLMRDRWMGATVFLVGLRPERWERVFVFERIETVDEERHLHMGHGYAGARGQRP